MVKETSHRTVTTQAARRERPPNQLGEFDRYTLDEPQDVVEYWALEWSENDQFHQPPHKAGTS